MYRPGLMPAVIILHRRKLGLKTESLQCARKRKTMRGRIALQGASREIHRDCFLSRELLECVPVLASLLLLTSLTLSAAVQAQPDSLEQLANDFWAWRAKYAPFTSDDVNRIERPGGMRDWSRASIDQRKKDLAGFEARWKKLNPAQWPIPKQVDYKLIGSALSRVRWELEINPRWKRDPNFYIEQTLTALAEALTVPAPHDEARSREILTRIENIPSILQQGSENLENPPAPFATVAVQNLDGIREHLHKMAGALVGSTTLKQDELNAATDRAADALEKFQQQLNGRLPKLPQQTALGRDAYIWFLRNVALMPFTPEELLAMGRQEWNRAVAFETYEKNRNKDVPPLKIATDINGWIKDAAAQRTSNSQGFLRSAAFSPCRTGSSITRFGQHPNICARLGLLSTTISRRRHD